MLGRLHISQRPFADAWLGTLGLRPGWTVYTALLVTMLVLLAPLLVLLAAAILVGAAVFLALSLLSLLLALLAKLLALPARLLGIARPPSDSRRNVRVIHPD